MIDANYLRCNLFLLPNLAMDLQELHSHFSFGWRYIILNAVVQIQLSSVMEVYV